MGTSQEVNMPDHYRRPGWFTRHIFNPTVAGLTRMGLSVMGSRVLEVKGRKSGLPRRVPVNLLTLDGTEYLVAPRGETEWVRNARAGDGRVALLLGRKREERTATELLDDAEKVPVLRAYLKRWKAEVGVFFEGVGPDSTDEELAAIAPKHPVFRRPPRPPPWSVRCTPRQVAWRRGRRRRRASS
jgi:deazaflavin-dependent oxidoreductase (nitroreductase family)